MKSMAICGERHGKNSPMCNIQTIRTSANMAASISLRKTRPSASLNASAEVVAWTSNLPCTAIPVLIFHRKKLCNFQASHQISLKVVGERYSQTVGTFGLVKPQISFPHIASKCLLWIGWKIGQTAIRCGAWISTGRRQHRIKYSP